MEVKLDQQARGVRFLTGPEAALRRTILNRLSEQALALGFEEVFLPSLEPAEIYRDKAGPEILTQMFTFKDRGDRNLCLRPEGTATIQLLAQKYYQGRKDIKLFYETRCWRYERPQAGRYREFTQFGCEILYPRDLVQAKIELGTVAVKMLDSWVKPLTLNASVKRGLAYYTEEGFELSCDRLGAEKQVCGGGSYKEGIGFAIGVDRVMLAWQLEQKNDGQ